jgi:NAD(P)-dependent dehydrogenase (short-subunit alcohol dehydrogenase family)
VGARRRFERAVVVISGGAGGLGAAFAQRFARAGASIALLDADPQKLDAACGRLRAFGANCVGLPCDVTDENAVSSAVDQVKRRYGGIDVLINNAGITHRSFFTDTAPAVLRKVIAVNLFGSIHCTKAALSSLLERRGLIIVISSIAGIAPLAERTGYAAGKHALHGLFGSLRAELRGTGVDVLIVCPGFTATGITSAALVGDGKPAPQPQTTVGKLATPESVADAVFDAATRGRRMIVLTPVGKLTALLQKLWPALYERLMTRSLERSRQATK